jgi:hypothetical protein
MRYWLIYDLSARANPGDLFEWLDAMEAVECGLFGATFVTDMPWIEVVNELTDAAGRGVRLYLIGRDPDGKLVGKFILGSRKSAPWEGYAPGDQPVEEEDR